MPVITMKKEIKEKSAVLKIVNQLFGSIPVFLQFYEKELPIKVITMKSNGLVVKLPVIMEKGKRILSVIHNNHKFSGEFEYLGGDNSGLEILSPVKFIIEEAKREIKRISIEPTKNEDGLFVTNFINQIDVNKSVGFSNKKIENSNDICF